MTIMERRFNLGRNELAGRRMRPAVAMTSHADGWRVELRRPGAVDGAHYKAWRTLAEQVERAGPYTHPDYQLTLARHASHGADVAFGFAYGPAAGGGEVLAAVLPVTLAHPIWGGAVTRLWEPPMATEPVEPLCHPGQAADLFEAMLNRLHLESPRARLRLERVPIGSGLLRVLEQDRRFSIVVRGKRAAGPIGYVPVSDEIGPSREVERVTTPRPIRNAIEQYLVADAELSAEPILAVPNGATIVRVVPRLFAHRGQACVELDWGDAGILAGAIWLGGKGERVLWHAFRRHDLEAMPMTVAADIVLNEAESGSDRFARIRLVN